MDASSYFKGKQVTLMGLGLLGRGVGDARYLAECGAELIVTDLKSREELAESVAQLETFPNITFVLGEHRLEDFRGRDFILKSAGVPLNSVYIAEAKKNNIPVRMSADLFAELSGISIVGVTGTRGKSTVTHMVHSILKADKRHVLLGGNVRGVSNLSLLREITSESIAVLELDSWQLQGWGEAKMSPRIAVFTTFYQDHLNYYKDTPAQYLADKANIFLYQNDTDVLIVGKQCAPIIIEKYGEQIESETHIVDELKLPDTWTLHIPGIHNRYNASLALAVARTLGIDDAISRTALESFAGVPGRLEFIREINGVKIYNDTTATTPEATLAALRALSENYGYRKSIILIMGGADKGLDMNTLLLEIPNYTRRVILLAGTGTSRVLEFIPEASVFDDLAKAVEEALIRILPGDIILFSPAFASFGMFKNEYDRGDQFAALVNAL
jgi:UDP-N-acetylmuramoylalanine--D-glutamate ligase